MSNYNQYVNKYLHEKTKRISLNFNLVHDKDILEAISREDSNNVQGAIKSLIRKAIDKES